MTVQADTSTEERGYSEGDRCERCGYWFWRDGGWHSLVAISYHDHPELANPVVCPPCAFLSVTSTEETR